MYINEENCYSVPLIQWFVLLVSSLAQKGIQFYLHPGRVWFHLEMVEDNTNVEIQASFVLKRKLARIIRIKEEENSEPFLCFLKRDRR